MIWNVSRRSETLPLKYDSCSRNLLFQWPKRKKKFRFLKIIISSLLLFSCGCLSFWEPTSTWILAPLEAVFMLHFFVSAIFDYKHNVRSWIYNLVGHSQFEFEVWCLCSLSDWLTEPPNRSERFHGMLGPASHVRMLTMNIGCTRLSVISGFANGEPTWAEVTSQRVSLGQTKVFFHLGISSGFAQRSCHSLPHPALALGEQPADISISGHVVTT